MIQHIIVCRSVSLESAIAMSKHDRARMVQFSCAGGLQEWFRAVLWNILIG
jgi:hypothetical protein